MADSGAGLRDKFERRSQIYVLTMALMYNRNMVKPADVPRSYQDLLDPKWKGKMLFDPEAAYIMAAMEHAWGRKRPVIISPG